MVEGKRGIQYWPIGEEGEGGGAFIVFTPATRFRGCQVTGRTCRCVVHDFACSIPVGGRLGFEGNRAHVSNHDVSVSDGFCGSVE